MTDFAVFLFGELAGFGFDMTGSDFEQAGDVEVYRNLTLVVGLQLVAADSTTLHDHFGASHRLAFPRDVDGQFLPFDYGDDIQPQLFRRTQCHRIGSRARKDFLSF